MPGAAFPARLRLPNQYAFKQVFDTPDWRISTPSLVALARRNTLPHPRLGLVVGKKSCRLASQRNRIKRLLRECFRQRQWDFAGIDIVLLVRSGLSPLDNAEITEQSTRVCNRLLKRIQEQEAAR